MIHAYRSSSERQAARDAAALAALHDESGASLWYRQLTAIWTEHKASLLADGIAAVAGPLDSLCAAGK